MVKVKVCGFTNLSDLLFADSLGVDFLGFIVDVPVATPRKITLLEAASLLSRVKKAKPVVVLMPSSLKQVEAVLELKPYAIQFHGQEAPAFLEGVKGISGDTKIIKALHIEQSSTFEEKLKEAASYAPFVDCFLLDTKTDRVGGTGVVHDWGISRRLASELERPVFLAGGLNPANVCEAVKEVKPYAVDVSSGVEASPGFKDNNKLELFVKEARKC